MSDVPRNLVASILDRLRTQAQQARVPFNQVLQFYTMERFLFRLSRTRHVDAVLLKGALLLRQAGVPRARPTMDIDLLRQGVSDRDSLIALVRDCALTDGEGDAVEFDFESIQATEITKEADYRGLRVRMPGSLGNVRLMIQVDFGVGDAVSPGPRLIEYPTLLPGSSITLRAYPIEASVAEKFQAMVVLDTANSRMKDFYDIWAYAGSVSFDGAVLAASIKATFDRRGTEIPSELPTALTSEFFAGEAQQQQWSAFIRRLGEGALAESLPVVARSIGEFLMPPAMAAARGEPFRLMWRPAGPWGADGAAARM